jgi:hypothetical protein
MDATLTPAVENAIAWAAITGRLPKGIRLHTWSAAIAQFVDSRTGGYVLKPGVEASGPIWNAHQKLLAAGFRWTLTFHYRNSRWLTYHRLDAGGDGWEALLWRDGHLSVYRMKDGRSCDGAADCVRVKPGGVLPMLAGGAP